MEPTLLPFFLSNQAMVPYSRKKNLRKKKSSHKNEKENFKNHKNDVSQIVFKNTSQG